MRANTIRTRWQAGEAVLTAWLTIPSSFSAELLAHCGFDCLTIDLQHGLIDYSAAVAMLQAISTTDCIPLARVPWNEPGAIMKLLDAGAYGIICPMINTAEEAAAFAAACRYPPAGIRGITVSGRGSQYGRVPDYLKRADGEICVLVQVETGEALARIEEIASVDGVDGVFIGPADLSASLGHIGNPGHPEVQAAIQDAVKRLTAIGKPAGILTPSEPDARRYIEWGYRFVAVGSDLGLMTKHADALAKAFAPQR